MKSQSLSDRMKSYEAQETDRKFIPLLPIYARIDGRSFSKFTRPMEKPFDTRLSEAMLRTTEALVGQTNACIGYTQSDEISLVWFSDNYESQVFFDGRIAKMTSILAAYASSYFLLTLAKVGLGDFIEKVPHFDARVIQLPNKTEAANMFLWREQDAIRNAIQSAAYSVYSTKELHEKSTKDMQEMLFEKGINFNDYPAHFKRGTFIRRETILRPAKEVTPHHRETLIVISGEDFVERHETARLDTPKFGSLSNREEFIFGAAPIVAPMSGE